MIMICIFLLIVGIEFRIAAAITEHLILNRVTTGANLTLICALPQSRTSLALTTSSAQKASTQNRVAHFNRILTLRK